jgi:hypothetical protein
MISPASGVACLANKIRPIWSRLLTLGQGTDAKRQKVILDITFDPGIAHSTVIVSRWLSCGPTRVATG